MQYFPPDEILLEHGLDNLLQGFGWDLNAVSSPMYSSIN